MYFNILALVAKKLEYHSVDLATKQVKGTAYTYFIKTSTFATLFDAR